MKSEKRRVKEFIEECSNANLLVNLGPEGKHYIDNKGEEYYAL